MGSTHYVNIVQTMCQKGVSWGFIDGLICEKGVKERAQRATILAVPAVENLHHGPYLYI